MKNGIIKMVNVEKRYGFITYDKGDIFFHFSNISNGATPQVGMSVTFEETEGSRGKAACNICISKEEISRATKFVKFDNARIKISNIKDYGIGSENLDEIIQKLVAQINDDQNSIKAWGEKFPRYENFVLKITQSQKKLEHFQNLRKTMSKMEYLYVTTYQNDNYTFYSHESSFNIYKKLEELDEIFC